MGDQFGLKASGEYREFGTGSRRDATGATKPRPDFLSPHAAMRFGEHMRKGADKYGAWNWSKGQPVSEMFASLYRHVLLFQQGDRSEDHLAAILFGAQGIMHFEELAQQGDEVALDMLDAYASLKLANDIRADQDDFSFLEPETNIQPMSEREFVQWHEGTPDVEPVTAEDIQEAQRIFAEGAGNRNPFSPGDRVQHRSGQIGVIIASFSNGDCKVRWGFAPDEEPTFYPSGLMKNFTRIED